MVGVAAGGAVEGTEGEVRSQQIVVKTSYSGVFSSAPDIQPYTQYKTEEEDIKGGLFH